MTHKFDVNNKNKLDNPKRREMLPIEKIFKIIGLRQGEHIADVGCGIGFFSIPAGKAIGENGVVYALDVEPSMIEETEHRIKESGLNNVKTAVTQEYDLKIKEDTVSLALICTVLHEVEDKIRFITETDRILKDNGRIAIIEWIKRETDWGPPVNHRVGSDELQKLLEECKFKDITVKELNEYFYVIMAEK